MSVEEYQRKKRACLNCGVSLKGAHPRRIYCEKVECQREMVRLRNQRYWRSKNVSNKRSK